MVFYKYHSLGNDFILTESVPVSGDLDDASTQASLGVWVAQVCNRHTGIGGDGVIFILNRSQGWHAYVFNSDGSYGQFSGNGVRCVAWFLKEHKKVSSPLTIIMGGMPINLHVNSFEGSVALITTSVALPRYVGAVELVVEGEKLTGHVVVGANPHLIIERNAQDLAWLQKHGKALEHYACDGSRINVECIWPVKEGVWENMNMRVFERGAGITQACSSGVIACQLFLTHFKKISHQQKVYWNNLGGCVEAVSYDDHLEISAPATFVFQGLLFV